ncbi:MAG TPA: polyprenyl synthetase family protein [Bacillota bacterium]|jgi:geranylgeranyl diphosphate synthase type II|nr:polyprenyl synthetase family protein [Peptococcaceae bacterium MAG4]NLW38875.1 polyprenyl synthetase family protein [Peptococcaceae bacterium]HPZ42512.1 polyprenyl synthetase family protein [Bacillota bacterium]HQD76169.1 polyprenyl synthetase family protein [Bacillota bacterium]HUM57739.1 polyprenyl synthetase family protein [Bacillota bacterium]
MNFKEELKRRAQIIEEALERFLPPPTAYPPLIHQAMRYSVLGGGKRLRPSLVMAGAEAVGGSATSVLPAACAVELIHVYSLIHDDLPALDNDDYRRGKLTNHKVFGEAIAVLAGDALLTLAFQLLAENKASRPEDNLRVIHEAALGAGTMGLIGGQVVDTFSAGEEVDEVTLEYIHRNKTGALYRISVRTGAILAGARPEQLEALSRYAEHLGLAFQIMDDILDLVGEEKKLGKPVGSDLKNKKATYPALFGLESSREKANLECARALSALSDFGKEADFLRSLAIFVVNRDY